MKLSENDKEKLNSVRVILSTMAKSRQDLLLLAISSVWEIDAEELINSRPKSRTMAYKIYAYGLVHFFGYKQQYLSTIFNMYQPNVSAELQHTKKMIDTYPSVSDKWALVEEIMDKGSI